MVLIEKFSKIILKYVKNNLFSRTMHVKMKLIKQTRNCRRCDNGTVSYLAESSTSIQNRFARLSSIRFPLGKGEDTQGYYAQGPFRLRLWPGLPLPGASRWRFEQKSWLWRCFKRVKDYSPGHRRKTLNIQVIAFVSVIVKIVILVIAHYHSLFLYTVWLINNTFILIQFAT